MGPSGSAFAPIGCANSELGPPRPASACEEVSNAPSRRSPGEEVPRLSRPARAVKPVWSFGPSARRGQADCSCRDRSARGHRSAARTGRCTEAATPAAGAPLLITFDRITRRSVPLRIGPRWSGFGQVATTKRRERWRCRVPQIPMVETDGERWRKVAKLPA